MSVRYSSTQENIFNHVYCNHIHLHPLQTALILSDVHSLGFCCPRSSGAASPNHSNMSWKNSSSGWKIVLFTWQTRTHQPLLGKLFGTGAPWKNRPQKVLVRGEGPSTDREAQLLKMPRARLCLLHVIQKQSMEPLTSTPSTQKYLPEHHLNTAL